MSHRRSSWALACLLALSRTPAPLAAAEPTRKGVDPAARRLLAEVVEAYKALPAYDDAGEFLLATSVGGADHEQRLPLHVKFARPNRIHIDAGLAHIVSDGKTLTTVVNPLRKYASVPAPSVLTFDSIFTAGPLGSSLFGGPGAPMMLVLMNLLVGADPAKAVFDLGDSLSVDRDREHAGKPSRVLRVASDGGPAFLLLVDPETRLLRAIELVIDPKALAESFPAGQEIKISAYRWSAGEVSAKPPAEAAFAFSAPDGFTRVDGLAQSRPAGVAPAPAKAVDAPEFKTTALIDKPAPDFKLTVFETEGKTKSISRDDLAGKVVMIDFWATWCGPCLAELPEVQRLIEAYSRDKKDVVVVALSQDDDPKDPSEVRKLIESTLAKHKIVLTGTPVGKVALDPSNAVGQAFQVEGYPTVVLIDRKGVVRAAHVGNSPDVGALLKREIDSLLDGKPVKKGPSDAGK